MIWYVCSASLEISYPVVILGRQGHVDIDVFCFNEQGEKAAMELVLGIWCATRETIVWIRVLLLFASRSERYPLIRQLSEFVARQVFLDPSHSSILISTMCAFQKAPRTVADWGTIRNLWLMTSKGHHQRIFGKITIRFWIALCSFDPCHPESLKQATHPNYQRINHPLATMNYELTTFSYQMTTINWWLIINSPWTYHH